MIRSPHKLVDLDVIAQAFFKDIDSELHLQQRLQTCPNNHIRPIVNYILTRLPLIITGRPDVLENEIGSIEPIIDNSVTVFLSSNPTLKDKKGRFITKISKRETLVRKNIKLEIKKLFDYDFSTDSFTKKDQGAIAYRHAERLGVNSCPYCNCNFTFTIRTKRMKSRPQFDHFLNKDRYPYLALSFFNLIPSCALCNSGALKGTKPFSIKTHLHPFIEDIEGLYEFKTNIDAVDFLVNNAMFTLEL